MSGQNQSHRKSWLLGMKPDSRKSSQSSSCEPFLQPPKERFCILHPLELYMLEHSNVTLCREVFNSEASSESPQCVLASRIQDMHSQQGTYCF